MPSTFFQEVLQEPEALRSLTNFYRREGRPLLAKWRELADKHRRIVFTGMGTSGFVAESILPGLAEQGIDATIVDAGEMLHYPRSFSGLEVLVSQSGESAETRKLAERLSNSEWVGITNNPESTIGRRAGLNLQMRAGHETGIANKTYVNTLALMFLMAQPTQKVEWALGELERVASAMQDLALEGIDKAAGMLVDSRAIHFVSRGPAMAGAKQCVLTFMEGTRTSCTAFTGGAFRHGPYELVDATHRCVFLIPGGRTEKLLKNMAAEVAGKGSQVVIITDQEINVSGSVCVLRVPAFSEQLFNIAAAKTQQLLLDALANRKGLEAGVFRNSQKITAVE